MLWDAVQASIIIGLGTAMVGIVALLFCDRNKTDPESSDSDLLRIGLCRLACTLSVSIALQFASFAAQRYYKLPNLSADAVCLGLIIWLIYTAKVIADHSPKNRAILGICTAAFCLVLISGCVHHLSGTWTYSWLGLKLSSLILLLSTTLYVWQSAIPKTDK